MNCTSTREQLIAEFTELRNATYPKDKYGRARYYDFLSDTDVLASRKTDAELERAIASLKADAA